MAEILRILTEEEAAHADIGFIYRRGRALAVVEP